MSDRSANESIKGYLYQFDASILQILNLENSQDEVEIEGVEDIDLHEETGTTAIQYKYYEGTEYNHSAISEAIRAMVKDFSRRRAQSLPNIRYRLVGHYRSGTEKLTLPFDVGFLKVHFLSYKKKSIQYRLHENLGLRDSDLESFVSNFSISIDAPSYEDQQSQVTRKLMSEFSCDLVDAEVLFYNSALTTVARIAGSDANRRIAKSAFIRKIDTKEILFNRWLVALHGRRKWIGQIRRRIQPGLNRSPFLRFFAIDVSSVHSNIQKISKVVQEINLSWSSKSNREPVPYCPIFFLQGLSESELMQLKSLIYNDGYEIVDGHPFKGATFRSARYSVQLPRGRIMIVRIVNTLDDLFSLYLPESRTTEFYEFYCGTTFTTSEIKLGNYLAIEIENIDEVLEVLR